MKNISIVCAALAALITPAFAIPAVDIADSEITFAANENWAKRFPQGYVLKDKTKVTSQARLKDKFVGVYCSAHWCGPCRQFTPQLVKFYAKNKAKLEIIFISSDQSEKDMYSYMKGEKMDWLAAPFRSAGAGSYSRDYGIRGIPNFQVFDKNGKLVEKNGRNLPAVQKLLDAAK